MSVPRKAQPSPAVQFDQARAVAALRALAETTAHVIVREVWTVVYPEEVCPLPPLAPGHLTEDLTSKMRAMGSAMYPSGYGVFRELLAQRPELDTASRRSGRMVDVVRHMVNARPLYILAMGILPFAG